MEGYLPQPRADQAREILRGRFKYLAPNLTRIKQEIGVLCPRSIAISQMLASLKTNSSSRELKTDRVVLEILASEIGTQTTNCVSRRNLRSQRKTSLRSLSQMVSCCRSERYKDPS